MSSTLSPGVWKAVKSPLLGWLRDHSPEIRNAVDNHYVRTLIGAYDTGDSADPFSADPADCMKAACDALESLGFVGITGTIDRSMRVLSQRLSFSRPVLTPRVNVTAAMQTGSSGMFRPIGREPTTEEAEVELARLTRFDSVIYERARAALRRVS